ncbi:MAG: glycosyltransferase [Bacteroidetes bacterium]|jgi:glycosyltransferase involved in cell wall biosynthesis|nr:glycosyltransferase [Bacteroidota bacterium]
MSRPKFTIVLPTTGNRGPLLPYSIGSIQNQTIQDFEIFIIGDGISEETRELIGEMIDKDSRIRLFDHPKHERRGEPYRHKALQEASSDFVCYLCDRDMMLPDHLETMAGLLEDSNFASTTFISVTPDQKLNLDQYIQYYGHASKSNEKAVKRATISLSNVAHTLDFYHKLPYGWRTTPSKYRTDVYMWQQFMAHPDSKAYSHPQPTILYFKRGLLFGTPVSEVATELAKWYDRIKEEKEIKQMKAEAFNYLITERRSQSLLSGKLDSTILIRGYTPTELISRVLQKAANLLRMP